MKKTIIIIFVILICSFGLIKIFDKKENDLVQIIDVENEVVTNLIKDTYKVNLTKEEVFDNSYDIEDINTKDLLSLSLNELDKEGKIHYCTLPSTFTLNELNNNIKNPLIDKKLTKKNIKKLFKKDTIYLGENQFYGVKIVGDKYEVTTVCGYTDPFNEIIKYNIKSAEKKDDYIYIDVFVAFGKAHNIKDVNDYYYNYYKDYEYKKHKETLFYEKNIDNNLYNIYTYTFKLFEDKYYLKSVELN